MAKSITGRWRRSEKSPKVGRWKLQGEGRQTKVSSMMSREMKGEDRKVGSCADDKVSYIIYFLLEISILTQFREVLGHR